MIALIAKGHKIMGIVVKAISVDMVRNMLGLNRKILSNNLSGDSIPLTAVNILSKPIASLKKSLVTMMVAEVPMILPDAVFVPNNLFMAGVAGNGDRSFADLYASNFEELPDGLAANLVSLSQVRHRCQTVRILIDYVNLGLIA
jgi:hypothetical protein